MNNFINASNGKNMINNNVRVDIYYSQPAFFSGDALCVNLEIFSPYVNCHTVSIDFIALQIAGVTFSKIFSDKCKEKTANRQQFIPITFLFQSSKFGSSGKLQFISKPCVICSNLQFVENGQTYWFGYECLIPPFVPPSFSGSSTKYIYYLLLTAQKRITNSDGNSQSFPFTLKMPIQIMGPKIPGMPLLPSCSPLIIPDLISAKNELRKNKFPPEDSSKISSFSHSSSTSDSFLNAFSSSFSYEVFYKKLLFDFQSKSWQGGNAHSQITLLKGLPGCEEVAPNFSSSTPSSIEVNLGLWKASHTLRKYGMNYIDKLLKTSVAIQTPVVSAQNVAPSAFNFLQNVGEKQEIVEESKDIRDAEFYNKEDSDEDAIEQYGKNIMTLTAETNSNTDISDFPKPSLLSPSVSRSNFSSPIVFSSCSSSLHLSNSYLTTTCSSAPSSAVQTLMNQNSLRSRDTKQEASETQKQNKVLLSANEVRNEDFSKNATSVILLEAEEDIEERSNPMNIKEKFRICSDGRQICVITFHKTREMHGHLCSSIGSCISVSMDFSDANILTYEVIIKFMREEKLNIISKCETKKEEEILIDSQTIWENCECVLHQIYSSNLIYIPQNTCPSFETDIVSVSYYISFQFYSINSTECQGINKIHPINILEEKTVRLNWRYPLVVVPPFSFSGCIFDKDDGSNSSEADFCTWQDEVDANNLADEEIKLYSLVGNTSFITEGFKKMYKSCTF